MKLKTIFAAVLLLAGQAYAQVTPSFAIDDDPICSVYKKAYNDQLNQGKKPSFRIVESVFHPDVEVYFPTERPSIPLSFSTPIVKESVKWMTWHPLIGVEHGFQFGGFATDVIAIGSIKPSAEESFLFQSSTIGWRGPFYKIYKIDDAKIASVIESSKTKESPVSIEQNGGIEIYPGGERTLYDSLVSLFEFKDNLYTIIKNDVYKVVDAKLTLVCKIGRQTKFKSSQITALENAANTSLMTKGVTHRPGYYGSMGNPHVSIQNGFDDAIYSPWLLKVADDGRCFKNQYINNCQKNKNVEAVLHDFASKGAWSYREAHAIREHMAGAKHVLKQYYIDELKLKKEIAEGMSNQAVYDFIERTVGLHPFIEYGVDDPITASDAYTLDKDGGSVEPNWFNKTALMLASHFNDYDAVIRLIERGDPVNAVTASIDEYGSVQYLNRSALTYAMENATLPVIKALIDAGADLNIEDSAGNALQYYLNKNNLVKADAESVANELNRDITASFDCEMARSKHEKAICNSKGLSVYDSQLSALYKIIRESGQYPEIRPLQRTWLKALRSECSMNEEEKLIQCMKRFYRPRIKYLNNLISSSP